MPLPDGNAAPLVAVAPHGRFFIASTAPQSLQTAWQVCQQWGATLPIINSANDQQQLVDLINESPALSSRDGADPITFLNAARTGTCTGSAASPECTYAMVQANNIAVTVLRGGMAVPNTYDNWAGPFLTDTANDTAVAIRRDGLWVNLSPTEPSSLPYATVCEVQPVAVSQLRSAAGSQLQSKGGNEFEWWMVVVPLLVAALVVVVCTGLCLYCEGKGRSLMPFVETTSQVKWGAIGEYMKGYRTIPDHFRRWYRLPTPPGFAQHLKASISSTANVKRGMYLSREHEELYLLLEHVPKYVRGHTAAVNPLMLLIKDGRYIGETDPMYPVELLLRAYFKRKANGESEASIGKWDFVSLLNAASDFQRYKHLSIMNRLDHIRDRLPPFVPGMPSYLYMSDTYYFPTIGELP